MSTTALQVSRPATASRVAGKPRLRLTHRGRVVFTTLAAAPLVILALILGLNGGMATATNTEALPLAVVTVEPGDSLWAIASEFAPETDPREFIAEVVHVNRLASENVFPGQQLSIPVR